MTVKIDDVVAKFMDLRRQKEAVEREAKQQVAGLNQQMKLLETYIESEMNRLGVSSFKTEYGSAYKTLTEKAAVADWTELIEYVKENDAYDLLQHRVSKQAVKQRVDMGETVPPGVNYFTETEIVFRKPKE